MGAIEIVWSVTGSLDHTCNFFNFWWPICKNTTTREGKLHILVISAPLHLMSKNCTMNIDHAWAGRLLSLPSPGRQRPWKVIKHIFDPLWLHCSADSVKRATELKSSQTKHVALAFWPKSSSVLTRLGYLRPLHPRFVIFPTSKMARSHWCKMAWSTCWTYNSTVQK